MKSIIAERRYLTISNCECKYVEMLKCVAFLVGIHLIFFLKEFNLMSMKFLSPEVTLYLYLYKSIIHGIYHTWYCLEYCCHFWTGAPGYIR